MYSLLVLCNLWNRPLVVLSKYFFESSVCILGYLLDCLSCLVDDDGRGVVGYQFSSDYDVYKLTHEKWDSFGEDPRVKATPRLLLEPTCLSLQLDRNLCGASSHAVPDWCLRGRLEDAVFLLDKHMFSLIRGILSYNFGDLTQESVEPIDNEDFDINPFERLNSPLHMTHKPSYYPSNPNINVSFF